MHNPPMSSCLILESGLLRCEIAPTLGGCIAGLWHGPQELLRSTPAAQLQSVRVAGSYPLLPYSNRIGQGRFIWSGKTYSLVPNFAPEPHAIHGVGWERAWTVESASATQAVLGYLHQADGAWPFAFEARQTITLDAQALQLQLSITNRASEPAPAGLGWHPYFAKSAQTHIQFEAAARWDMGADMLPTQRRAHPGLAGDCSSLDVDHCFEGWSGKLLLTEGGLRLRLQSDLSCLVVYTTPQRDSIALEPVSHVNNALQLAQQDGESLESLGLRSLQPGQTLSAHMSITVEAQP